MVKPKNLLLYDQKSMILKLGMKYQGLMYYKVYINYDNGLTMTYFTLKSKLSRIICILMGKTIRKSFNGTLIESYLMGKTCSK